MRCGVTARCQREGWQGDLQIVGGRGWIAVGVAAEDGNSRNGFARRDGNCAGVRGRGGGGQRAVDGVVEGCALHRVVEGDRLRRVVGAAGH